jgi:hypothetical protein
VQASSNMKMIFFFELHKYRRRRLTRTHTHPYEHTYTNHISTSMNTSEKTMPVYLEINKKKQEITIFLKEFS